MEAFKQSEGSAQKIQRQHPQSQAWPSNPRQCRLRRQRKQVKVCCHRMGDLPRRGSQPRRHGIKAYLLATFWDWVSAATSRADTNGTDTPDQPLGEVSDFKARNGNISSHLHNSGRPPSIPVRSGKPFVWLAESTFLERCRRRRRPQVPAGGGCKQDNMHTEIYRTIVYGISLRP